MEKKKKLKEENVERLERLEAADKKEEEKELAELAEARNLADAEEMLNYANIKKKLVLPSLGYHVYYCPIRIKDRIEINNIRDKNLDVQRDLRNRKHVHLLLSRAETKYTKEVVEEMPAFIIDVILHEYDMAEDGRFLLPVLRRRSAGLRRTLKPRE